MGRNGMAISFERSYQILPMAEWLESASVAAGKSQGKGRSSRE